LAILSRQSYAGGNAALQLAIENREPPMDRQATGAPLGGLMAGILLAGGRSRNA